MEQGSGFTDSKVFATAATTNVARVDNVAVYHYCDDHPCDATGYRAGVGYPAL